MSKEREPVEFEARGRTAVLAFDVERTAYAIEQDETADRTGVVLSEEEKAVGSRRPEYWSVTWNGERAGSVHRFEGGQWWYSGHGGNGVGGFATAEEAAQKLAERYGYFRLTGWIYRPVGGWKEWRKHVMPGWWVSDNDFRRVRVTSPEERDAAIVEAKRYPPQVEEFEFSVSCEADKPDGETCQYCEEG